MPIHDLGYRSLGDHSRNLSFRWLVIGRQGMSLAWKNVWLRRLVYLVFIPTFWVGFLFFAFEYFAALPMEEQMQRSLWKNVVQNLPVADSLRPQLGSNPADARSPVWTYLLLTFMHTYQVFYLTLMIGLVAPPLISQDLLRKTFVLYFSRPIRRIDYLVGKASVVLGYGFLITAVPALVIFTLAVFLSPSLAVLGDTWHLPLRILLSSTIVLVPTTLVALLFSSFTTSSRYATFAWFALWIVGTVAFRVLDTTRRIVQTQQNGQIRVELIRDENLYYLLSPYETLGRAQEWVFNTAPLSDVVPAMVAIGAVTLVSFVVLFRRINAPLKA